MFLHNMHRPEEILLLRHTGRIAGRGEKIPLLDLGMIDTGRVEQ